MPRVRSAALQTGIAGGALFFLHGFINGSRFYPFVWPTLAGAVAFLMATSDAIPHRFRHGLFTALAVGALAGSSGLSALP